MDQYLLIAFIVIIVWLVGFGIYLAISSRQRNLEGELIHISELLEDDGADQG